MILAYYKCQKRRSTVAEETEWHKSARFIGSYNAPDEPRLRIHGLFISIDLQPISGRLLILMARSIGEVIEGLGE